MHELVAFAQLQEQRFKARNAGKASDTERLYAQTVKLGEEFGELCEAIMAHAGHQRKDKLEQHIEEGLAHELADCTIVLFTLAAKLDIDLPKALTEKIAVVNERFKDMHVN